MKKITATVMACDGERICIHIFSGKCALYMDLSWTFWYNETGDLKKKKFTQVYIFDKCID